MPVYAVRWTAHARGGGPAGGTMARAARLLAPGAFAAISALHHPEALSAPARAADLVDLSLEQLSNIVVSSVSRHDEPLSQAPASVYVISAEDIRRSGAVTLPEALRLAPNLQVARADATQYAISARGFNNVLANKLLVMIDGRVVYSPLFSGVLWEAQDVMLEDVERIEVISGPGTTLWGANAVNGVINVITRSSEQTQGALAAVGTGNIESGAAVRYGGRVGERGFVRVYGKYLDQDNTQLTNGNQVRDAANHWQSGFRADWPGGPDHFTLQGNAYSGNVDQFPSGRNFSGANLLTRWDRQFASGSSLRLQGYYDHTERDDPSQFRDRLDTMDLELQHQFHPLASHQVDWGGGYRHSSDRTQNGAAFGFHPPDRELDWLNVFLQDQIALTAGLDLIAGAKLERNSYTGNEFLPNLRLAWRVTPDHFLWAAASRAVRAPSRVDREYFAPASPPYFVAGGPVFESEIAKVYELGYRAQPLPELSLSITAFYNQFTRLRSIEQLPGGAQFENRFEGTSSGVELSASLRVTPRWRLTGGLVTLNERLLRMAGSTDVLGAAALGNDPDYWWSVRSLLDLTSTVQLDATFRQVGPLPSPRVPSYSTVEARIGWRPTRQLELSVTLQNLFDPAHTEWGAAGNRVEFGRAIFFRVMWRS
ncbi:MAG: TonB-dependent receptor [Betaproteobacteria bacterium]